MKYRIIALFQFQGQGLTIPLPYTVDSVSPFVRKR